MERMENIVRELGKSLVWENDGKNLVLSSCAFTLRKKDDLLKNPLPGVHR